MDLGGLLTDTIFHCSFIFVSQASRLYLDLQQKLVFVYFDKHSVTGLEQTESVVPATGQQTDELYSGAVLRHGFLSSYIHPGDIIPDSPCKSVLIQTFSIYMGSSRKVLCLTCIINTEFLKCLHVHHIKINSV